MQNKDYLIDKWKELVTLSNIVIALKQDGLNVNEMYNDIIAAMNGNNVYRYI